MGHFFPSYPMDLSRTLYMFSSGRFEPRNKGFDLCLEALARLNAQLRDFDIPVNVVFFLISQRPTRSLLPGVLEKRGLLGELRAVCDGIVSEVSAAMFQRAAAGDPLEMNALVSEYWALRYRRTQQALRSRGLPEIITHQLEDEHADPVLAYIRLLGLHNRQEDPVKVVYHPAFISTTNPLWGMEYDQFVRGCHLGVFPSAYEPWGHAAGVHGPGRPRDHQRPRRIRTPHHGAIPRPRRLGRQRPPQAIPPIPRRRGRPARWLRPSAGRSTRTHQPPQRGRASILGLRLETPRRRLPPHARPGRPLHRARLERIIPPTPPQPTRCSRLRGGACPPLRAGTLPRRAHPPQPPHSA